MQLEFECRLNGAGKKVELMAGSCTWGALVEIVQPRERGARSGVVRLASVAERKRRLSVYLVYRRPGSAVRSIR